MNVPDRGVDPGSPETTKGCAPADPGGVTQVILVFEICRTAEAGDPPIVTRIEEGSPRPARLSPESVIGVPPAAGAQSGVAPRRTGEWAEGSHEPRTPTSARNPAEAGRPATGGDATTAP